MVLVLVVEVVVVVVVELAFPVPLLLLLVVVLEMALLLSLRGDDVGVGASDELMSSAWVFDVVEGDGLYQAPGKTITE